MRRVEGRGEGVGWNNWQKDGELEKGSWETKELAKSRVDGEAR